MAADSTRETDLVLAETGSAHRGLLSAQFVGRTDWRDLPQEEEYTDAISEIIKRDFFGTLLELDANKRLHRAVQGGTPSEIEESVRRMREIMTPTPRRRNLGQSTLHAALRYRSVLIWIVCRSYARTDAVRFRTIRHSDVLLRNSSRDSHIVPPSSSRPFPPLRSDTLSRSISVTLHVRGQLVVRRIVAKGQRRSKEEACLGVGRGEGSERQGYPWEGSEGTIGGDYTHDGGE